MDRPQTARRTRRGSVQATPSATRIIAVLGFCGALVSISQTVTLPLLPLLPDELDTSVSNVSWVATAAFLTGAVSNPVFGRMGDMYGKRRMVLVALALLAVGCVIAAVAPNVLVLVIGRALQGCGIAVIPLGMSIAKETLPPTRRARGSPSSVPRSGSAPASDSHSPACSSAGSAGTASSGAMRRSLWWR